MAHHKHAGLGGSIVRLTVLLCLLVLSPIPAAVAAERTLVVGSEENFPPFSIGSTDDTADGFTVDLWKEVAREAGLKYSIRVRPWGQILQEFKEGKIDVLINIAQSEERHRYTDFSVSHVTVNGAIFVRKGNASIRSEADLAGKSIIVFRSDLAHEYAVSKGWQKQLVVVDTPQEGLQLLASGQHDAMLLSKLAGVQTLRALHIENVRPLNAPAGYAQKFSFGVRKGDADLLARLNEGLALTKADGDYDALYQKWFGIYEEKQPTLRDVLPYLVPVVAASLVIAAYNFRRRRMERQRARKALQASEENLRLILDSAGEAIYGIDLGGLCTFCNPACVKMLGYRNAEDLIGKHMHTLIHHSHADGRPYPAEQCRIHRAFQLEQGVHADDEVLWRADGTSFAAEYRSYPQLKEGRTIGAVVIFSDITERRFKENAHRHTTLLLQIAGSYTNLRECLSAVTASLQVWSGCEAVGIRLREGEEYPYYETIGFPAAFVEAERHICAYGPDGSILVGGDGVAGLECTCGKILRGTVDTSKDQFTPRGSFWTNSTSALLADSAAPSHTNARNRCISEGYQSVALIPMHAGDQIIGLIQFNDHRPDRFTPVQIEILEGVADKLALAMSRRQAEIELSKSEKLLRDLLNTIPDMVWLKDPNGIYRSCNATFERLLGLPESDILGKTDYDLVDRDLADFFREHDRKAMAAGRASSNEEWVTFTENGQRTLLYTTKVPMYDDRGTPIGVLGVGRDITEIKQTEEELRQTKAMLQAAMDCSPAGIIIADAPDCRLRYVNDSALLISDNDRRSINNGIGTDHCMASWKFLDLGGNPLDGDQVPLLRSIRHGETTSREIVIRRGNGDDRIVAANAAPIRNEGGDITAGIMVITDITEQKRQEHALRKSEQELRSLAEAMPQIVWITRPDGWNIYFNQQWVEYTGLTLAESRGHGWTKPFHPDDQRRAWEAWNNAVNHHGTYELECRLRRADGAYRWWLIRGVPLVDEKGQVIKWFGTCTDIDTLKKSEEEKLALVQQLNQAQKMESVGCLAGGVAHDFNNKLSVILGHAYLALTESVPENIRDSLDEIRKAAEQSAELTRQLLAFARKQTIAPRVIDVNQTITSMLRMLQRLIGEQIQLVWQPAHDLWPIKFDPSQMDQILANLCVNARDAITHDGRIVLEAANCVIDQHSCGQHPFMTPGEYVRLVVSDNGCGMDKETLNRIFEPFFTTKETGKGTGLGLATVFGIIKQNSGFINVYSEPGLGSSFTLYLPRYAGETDQEPKERTAPAPRGQETILLVEDEQAILNVVTTILARQGYSVLRASTPSEALRLAGSHPGEIGLLLTDVIMPEMTGKDLALSLKTSRPQLKCLFMSGYTADAIAHHGVLGEGIHFIQKPFPLPTLAAKVREVLDAA